MKRIVYNMIACCFAAFALAACSSDNTPSEYIEPDGNSIILDISSASLPVSRSTATGAEIALSHIDVLIFEAASGEAIVHHERVSASARSGVITLNVARNSFTSGSSYWVYLIANSTHPATDFSGLTNLSGLKAMTQTDPDIHMTGYPDPDANVPRTFLMDGVAYLKSGSEPTTPGAVVLYDGVRSNNTELAVTLRRAAAKILVTINKGADVTFEDDPTLAFYAGYYLRNMPYSTSVIAGVNATASLRTPDKNVGSYFHWEPQAVTITAYAYAHDWTYGSVLEDELRLVVNIPLWYDDGVNSPYFLENSYYQIPVSKDKVLKRNTCYQVTVTVNAPGAESSSEPIELEDIEYSVMPWIENVIDIGGEDDHPIYLTLNRYEMDMHNKVDDNTTLRFASSSNVSVAIQRAYYISKLGVVTDVTNAIRSSITATADAGLSGNIAIHSPLPTNNAVRYIELLVTNADGVQRNVTVAQYPLEYIVGIQGWYSYRDDFEVSAGAGVTTWEAINGIPVAVGSTYTNASNLTGRYWGYNFNTDTYVSGPNATGNQNAPGWGSKVVTATASSGTSTIHFYYWRRSGNNGNYTYTRATQNNNIGFNNARMYHVRITASSGDYTLGIPRLNASGYTDSGADNAVLVSPSFMIASQLGGLSGASNANYPTLTQAAEHCKQYVEVAGNASDKVVYDDWRLPTKAEINIIMRFQAVTDSAIDTVLSGPAYWSAGGEVNTTSGNYSSPQPTRALIRCIRDAY